MADETMSTSKRAVTLRILSDEAFGPPSQASGLEKKYPELNGDGTILKSQYV